MAGCWEAGHVDTDLGDDDLRGLGPHARDRDQVFPGVSERGDHRVDPGIEPGKCCVEEIDVPEQFPGHSCVVLVEPARHRPAQIDGLGFQFALGQPGEGLRTAF